MKWWNPIIIALGSTFGPLFMSNIADMGRDAKWNKELGVAGVVAALLLLARKVYRQGAEIHRLKEIVDGRTGNTASGSRRVIFRCLLAIREMAGSAS